MDLHEAYAWLLQGLRRQRALLALTQPLTVKQLAERIALRLQVASYVLYELEVYELVRCLSPSKRRNRVYGLTVLGLRCQRRLSTEAGLPLELYNCPVLDWEKYSDTCFSHRAAVIQAMQDAMQACEIRRRACRRLPWLRMSANNARDVLRELCQLGITSVLHPRHRSYPLYVLSSEGLLIQRLLRQAKTPCHRPPNT